MGFLSAMNKAVETGMKASGMIEGGRTSTQVSVDQVIVLPLPPAPKPTNIVTIKAQAGVREREQK